MNLREIKDALDRGDRVFVGSRLYEVVRDSLGQHFIVCLANQYAIGLTHRDGVTLNESESSFFVDQQSQH